jgi:phospholipid/cholesterol/gamma-HCH transport system substrate-binding protein
MTFDRDDAKIGLLVLAALAVFLGLLFQRGMAQLVKQETPQYVRLQNAAEVTVGTEVQLQGVRIGQVNRVDLEQDGVVYRITARLGLQPKIVLWKGTRALVASKTFGGAYLDLQLPAPEARREVLPPGAVLEATVAPSLGSAIEEIQTLVHNLNLSVDGLRQHIEKKGLGALLDQPGVKQILTSLDETLKAYGGLAKDGDALLRKADPSVSSLQRSLASVEATLAVVEKRKGDLDALITSLSKTMKEMEGLSGEIRGNLKTALPETEETLRALHRNLNATEELLELLKAKPSRVLWGTPSEAEKEAARRKAAEAQKVSPTKQ